MKHYTSDYDVLLYSEYIFIKGSFSRESDYLEDYKNHLTK